MSKPIRPQIMEIIKRDIQEFISHNRNNLISSVVEQINTPDGMENSDFIAIIDRCVDSMVEHIERKIS